MKKLIFNKELFDNSNYSSLFQSVVSSLMKSGVIASPEASEVAFRAIWQDGKDSQCETAYNKTYTEKWVEFKKENL